MQTINVEGLPEPIAQALEAFAQTLRDRLHRAATLATQTGQRNRVQLPTRPGKVIGSLTREEIYGNGR